MSPKPELARSRVAWVVPSWGGTLFGWVIARQRRGRSSGQGLARVPERLPLPRPPPLSSPQLRRYLELHILLFAGLRHVLSRDSDLRGTAEAPWAVLEFGMVKCGMHHGADLQ
jgi:hypothetical protein